MGIRNCKLYVLEIRVGVCYLMVFLHDPLQVINVGFKALFHVSIVLAHFGPFIIYLLLFNLVFVEKFCMFFFAFSVEPSQILNFMMHRFNFQFHCLNFDLLLSVYLISSHELLVLLTRFEITTVELERLILVEVSWGAIEYIIDVFFFHS